MFSIDYKSRLPFYEQLVESVKSMVLSGLLSGDDPLPSVRQLSSDLGINPNTVQKAYRQLEEEGLIQSRPGAGSHITASPQQVEDIRQELFRSEVQETVAAMKRMGLKKEEAVALLRQLYDEEERE